MSLRPTFRFLSILIIFLSLSLLIPGVIEYLQTSRIFFFEISLFSILAVLPVWFFTRKAKSLNNKDIFLVIVLSWVITGVFSAMPFYISGQFDSFTNALFEAISGVTTTGSTVLVDIESLSKGLLFWRSFIQWIGGLGIIVFTISLLPLIGVSGEKLFNVEFPGPSSQKKIAPRVKDTSRLLIKFYLGFTFAEFTLLLYRMPAFDAICHALTTMPTGGFSTFNASLNEQDLYVKSVILLFMILAGTNFALHFRVQKNGFRTYSNDREFLYYMGLIIIASTSLILLMPLLGDNGVIIDPIFQVVSIITTTGYTAIDYSQWSLFLGQFILLILMFFGAMGGSTSGGMKLIRIVAIIKYARMELKRALHDKAIIPIRIGHNLIPDEVIRKTLAFFLFYISFFFFATVAFVIFGNDLETAVGIAVSSIGNVGPGFGEIGAMGNYDSLSVFGKYIMMFGMLLGRLEIFAILILFTKTFWRS